MNDTKEKLRQIALRDGRYRPDAFYFLFEALETAVRLAGKESLQGPARHVTGQEVLQGMRAHATASFGPLAPYVWRAWGVKETLDWGHIVFLLVEQGLLKRQDEDKIDDFRAGFDFDRAFEQDYRRRLAEALAARTERRSGEA
jgi:uncharacterized repeat protein (TIGR04138 family)